MRKLIFILFMILAIVNSIDATIIPNPIISRGKPVYTSKGRASYLVDNIFNSSSFSVSNNSWIAIKIDSGYSKVFLNWNNPNYSWSDTIAKAHSCNQKVVCPINYTIQTSSNSTNGADGNWITKDSIIGNTVTARGHLIDFKGASWIKMFITSGGGLIDEVEIFDVIDSLKVAQDSWFFPGTSITANAFKATPPSKNFADIVAKNLPGYNPVIIRGGIPCINSGDLVKDITKYLKTCGNVKYWAIEMGTNDAWGGSNANASSFKSNLKIVIDSCKARGIQPIISRMIATNATAAGWQVNPDFLTAIDSLTSQNHLIAGPDFYAWFLSHASELNSDGVHPNNTGAASMQRLWAEKMSSIYGGCNASKIIPYIKVNSGTLSSDTVAALNSGDTIILSPQPSNNGSWLWSGPNGFTSTSREIKIENIQTNQAGNYMATYMNNDSCGTSIIKISVKELTLVNSNIVSQNIVIFPNPTEGGKFRISINSLTGVAQIRIYDIQGKIAYHSTLTSKETNLNTGLKEGLYFVKIINGENSFNKKIIVK